MVINQEPDDNVVNISTDSWPSTEVSHIGLHGEPLCTELSIVDLYMEPW